MDRKNKSKMKGCGDYCYCAWCDWLGYGKGEEYCEKAKREMKKHNRVEEQRDDR